MVPDSESSNSSIENKRRVFGLLAIGFFVVGLISIEYAASDSAFELTKKNFALISTGASWCSAWVAFRFWRLGA